jgi:5'-deoxynucleotidase YfbR-like HD superfamily hydrolase
MVSVTPEKYSDITGQEEHKRYSEEKIEKLKNELILHKRLNENFLNQLNQVMERDKDDITVRSRTQSRSRASHKYKSLF